MPEPSVFFNRKPVCDRTVATHREQQPLLPYAELHCLTNFTFLEGASHPDELVVRAAELGYKALAVTDRNSLAGVVRAHAAAEESGIKLIVGSEITPADAPPIVLLATDRAAYGRLARLITLGRRRAEKGACHLELQDIATYNGGLLAMVIFPREVQPCGIKNLHAYRDIFGDRLYALAELHYGVDDYHRLDQLVRLADQSSIPLVAGGDVHYHARQRMVLQHALTAIRHGTTVTKLGRRCLPNAERHLRSLEEIQAIFSGVSGALQRTIEIADRCTFSLDQLRYEYPEELAPSSQTPMQYLHRLVRKGANERYGTSLSKKVGSLLEHELKLIEQLHYEAFFLTVNDIVQFARSRGILCQGRGSAANSAVCYCLGITTVDPNEHELLFERFMSEERNESPDIDVDFEHERREEVLQYVYHKYGRERAGLAATVITYRVRSAIRDVGKALGLSIDCVDALAKNYDSHSEGGLIPERCRQSGIDPESQIGRQLLMLVNDLVGFPRHLSQHVGGMVITRGPLCEVVPIENAAMQDRTVIEWDKDDLNELGILKVDCLALGMLTAIRKCFDFIKSSTGRSFSIDTIPAEDPDVYAMISRADTVGVFQIESRAQMNMLPQLKPKTFYDLVIEVAIVRPGPIQGDMVHPYLRRRNKEEKVEYESKEVEGVLRRTLGVPLFQEQAMQLAVVAAGFSPGEADHLRRAMGGWRRPGLIDNYHKMLTDGMLAKGYSPEFSEQLFNQIRGFGNYGFPESHAASFAKLVYVSSWLKHYHPAAFAAGIINSQPMGFYSPAQLVRDAKEHGVEVRPSDVNHSDWDCTLEPAPPALSPFLPLSARDGTVSRKSGGSSLRLGMRLIRGLQESTAHAIVEARLRPYRSVGELGARAGVGKPVIEQLAEAGALESLQFDRRTALWQALDQPLSTKDQPLFGSLAADDTSAPELPALSLQEEVFSDYQTTGLSLRDHPISFFRDRLDVLGATPASELTGHSHGSAVTVAGLVLMRQRPGTAKGITFLTLEDESGMTNLIIHRQTWKKFELVARRSKALIACGLLERKESVVHIIVSSMQDLETQQKQLRHSSRDFR
ncbi:MAG: error-prone DNA polymerase [Pirellulales bacterium]|nr:error-prone DNA polymerase [Pirellulales bacterium]